MASLLEPPGFVVVVVLLFYVPGKQLVSCRSVS